MKSNTFLFKIFILVSILLNANHFLFGQCKAKDMVKKTKVNITKPYVYDCYVLNELEFTDIAKKIEVQFTAFHGQKYRILFLTSGFEEKLEVNIYDKSNRVKTGRKKVFDTNEGIDNNYWSFQPIKSGNFFIEYTVPPSVNAKLKKGCVIMIIGYIGAGTPEDD